MRSRLVFNDINIRLKDKIAILIRTTCTGGMRLSLREVF